MFFSPRHTKFVYTAAKNLYSVSKLAFSTTTYLIDTVTLSNHKAVKSAINAAYINIVIAGADDCEIRESNIDFPGHVIDVTTTRQFGPVQKAVDSAYRDILLAGADHCEVFTSFDNLPGSSSPDDPIS